MGFFSRTASRASVRRGSATEDRLIVEIGQTADQVMLNVLRGSRESSDDITKYLAEQRVADEAWWAARHRQQAEELNRAHPGYREELNKQRIIAGFPPV